MADFKQFNKNKLLCRVLSETLNIKIKLDEPVVNGTKTIGFYSRNENSDCVSYGNNISISYGCKIKNYVTIESAYNVVTSASILAAWFSGKPQLLHEYIIRALYAVAKADKDGFKIIQGERVCDETYFENVADRVEKAIRNPDIIADNEYCYSTIKTLCCWCALNFTVLTPKQIEDSLNADDHSIFNDVNNDVNTDENNDVKKVNLQTFAKKPEPENNIILKSDYLRNLLNMNTEQREKTVAKLCWSKDWVEKYYGYNSDHIIDGLTGEFIVFMWLNSNKFCKYFEVKYSNLFMIEGSKQFNLQNQPDIKLNFEDKPPVTAEIKTTGYSINYDENDKPSIIIPLSYNKAIKENAEMLFIVNTSNYTLITVDLKADKFISCCNIQNIYSLLLKVLLDNNSLSRILGFKGHVVM